MSSGVAVQVYGWSTCVDTIVKEFVKVLQDTTDLPVKANPYTWNPLDSTDDRTLFILMIAQTVTVYPMYYVAYQTEQWGTSFLDEGGTNWGVPRGKNATTNYREVCSLDFGSAPIRSPLLMLKQGMRQRRHLLVAYALARDVLTLLLVQSVSRSLFWPGSEERCSSDQWV